jgi:Caenorhabditis protein of unknown function, DUF268
MMARKPGQSFVRSWARQYPYVYGVLRRLWRALSPFALQNPLSVAVTYVRCMQAFRAYRRMPGGEGARWRDWYPMLRDRTTVTPVDLNYFYQDTWAAGKILAARPMVHVDLGSTALLVGILARWTRVISVDVRPLSVELDGLVSCAGTGVALPFRDRSIRSLSSLCVLEHIGLGRYGDPLDPQGTEKTAAELQRILAPGGDLYVSVPIEREDRVYFNAHRAFSMTTVAKVLSELDLEDTVLVQGHVKVPPREIDSLDFDRQMGVFGLFHFRRPAG